MSDEELEVDVVSDADDELEKSRKSPVDFRKESEHLKTLCDSLKKRHVENDGERSKTPVSTTNSMYTSFSISSILNRVDSKADTGNGHSVLDAASSFLAHHPDPAMLSR